MKNPRVPIPRLQEFSTHSQPLFVSISIHSPGSTFWSRSSLDTKWPGAGTEGPLDGKGVVEEEGYSP